MKRLLIALLAGLTLGLPSAIAQGGRVGTSDDSARMTESGPPLVVTPRGNFTLAKARSFADFAAYFVGSSFDSHALEAVIRRDEPGKPRLPVRANYLEFLYGACEIPIGADGSYHGGCPPPLSVQVWPACERYQALYPFEPDETVSVRGVSASFYEGHRRLEIYTGASTVVLFGSRRSDLLRAAAQLRGVNVEVNASEPLPAEEPGAQAGGIACR